MNKYRDTPNNIDTLVTKLLLGSLTAEEEEALRTFMQENPQLVNEVKCLLEEQGLTERYRQYLSIDVEKAKAVFLSLYRTPKQTKNISTKIFHLPQWRRWASAAAILCFIIASAWMWLGKEHDSPTIPTLTAEMSRSIERMEQSGMNGATLTVHGNKTVTVQNAQMAQAQMSSSSEYNSIQPDATEIVYEGTLVTHHDKEFWMLLDDGTYVHLNYDSKLIYPNHFVEDERRVTLVGEAYFIVAKDKKRPFIVHTPNGDVRDYGTEFNVNTRAKKGNTNVVLVNGKVGVACKGGAEVLLQPGDMATLGTERIPLISKVDVTPYIAWNTGNFHFDGCSLEQLMQVIGHWYNMEVIYISDDIRGIRFTGDLDKYEPLSPTLHAIETITNLKIAQEDGVITISKK